MVEQTRSDPMIAKILSPEWAAVLVVDVQNDFCHEQGAMGRIRPYLRLAISRAAACEQ